jgi:hypothetical protein
MNRHAAAWPGEFSIRYLGELAGERERRRIAKLINFQRSGQATAVAPSVLFGSNLVVNATFGEMSLLQLSPLAKLVFNAEGLDFREAAGVRLQYGLVSGAKVMPGDETLGLGCE